MTIEQLQHKYLGEGEIHLISKSDGKIIVHYRRCSGNTTAAMEQAAVLHELVADAGASKVEFQDVRTASN